MSRLALKSLLASAVALALLATPALADGRHGGWNGGWNGGHGHHGGGGWKGGHHHHHRHGGWNSGYRGYSRYNPGCYPRYGYGRPSYYYLAPPIWVQPRSGFSFYWGF